MKILILEDSAERVRKFRQNLFNCSLTVTDDVEFCISQLKNNNWDALFLDHDLGGSVFSPSNENSGYCVAKWLRDNPERKPEQIFIHSLNFDGVERMRLAIPEAIVSPFVWQSVRMEDGELKGIDKNYSIGN